jgi:hypothetical protein
MVKKDFVKIMSKCPISDGVIGTFTFTSIQKNTIISYVGIPHPNGTTYRFIDENGNYIVVNN